MPSLLTYFDSKRYHSFKKFQDFYLLRKKYLHVLPEQEAQYQQMFQSQSIRYTFQVQSTWIEETFESMDGNYLTFYHDRMEQATLTSFFEEMLHYFDYVFGGVSAQQQVERAIIDCLVASESFTYELDTLVYKQPGVECYITVTVFLHGNFALKIFEKEDYEPSVKTELMETIQQQLLPILQGHDHTW